MNGREVGFFNLFGLLVVISVLVGVVFSLSASRVGGFLDRMDSFVLEVLRDPMAQILGLLFLVSVCCGLVASRYGRE